MIRMEMSLSLSSVPRTARSPSSTRNSALAVISVSTSVHGICLELKDPATGEHAESFFGICELVKPRDCVGCKLCEEVSIKDAIRVESPILVEWQEAAD